MTLNGRDTRAHERLRALWLARQWAFVQIGESAPPFPRVSSAPWGAARHPCEIREAARLAAAFREPRPAAPPSASYVGLGPAALSGLQGLRPGARRRAYDLAVGEVAAQIAALHAVPLTPGRLWEGAYVGGTSCADWGSSFEKGEEWPARVYIGGGIGPLDPANYGTLEKTGSWTAEMGFERGDGTGDETIGTTASEVFYAAFHENGAVDPADPSFGPSARPRSGPLSGAITQTGTAGPAGDGIVLDFIGAQHAAPGADPYEGIEGFDIVSRQVQGGGTIDVYRVPETPDALARDATYADMEPFKVQNPDELAAPIGTPRDPTPLSIRLGGSASAVVENATPYPATLHLFVRRPDDVVDDRWGPLHVTRALALFGTLAEGDNAYDLPPFSRRSLWEIPEARGYDGSMPPNVWEIPSIPLTKAALTDPEGTLVTGSDPILRVGFQVDFSRSYLDFDFEAVPADLVPPPTWRVIEGPGFQE